jgi:paraquat-inducible protein A
MDSWTMVEVFMLGFLVAYTRMQAMAHVILGPAVYGMIGLMLSLVAADAVLDSEAVWERIPSRHKRAVPKKRNAPLLGCDTCHLVSYGIQDNKTAHCPRCGEVLHKRKPASLTRTWALSLAALVLYIPSNIYPIMTVVRLGKAQSYTIIGGMMELAHAGLVPLAILVFCASIVIPIFKLLSLGYLLISTHQGSHWQLHNRTRLYRVIDFIGRWSMVDVFMVSILVALVHFGLLADVVAESGALYFASVVLLTMVAVKCFDSRLMWDAAHEAAPQPVVSSKTASLSEVRPL